jgi:alkanesulfonate monooxygenase
MPVTTSERLPRIFTVIPRTPDVRRYSEDLDTLVRWSDRSGCTGVLLFTGTHTPIDPWVAAQRIIAQSQALEPIIAVNPAYMHPLNVARIVSSIAQLYQRKVHLNLIAGTSLSELESLGDDTGHDKRYDRLNEYVDVLRLLMANHRPVSMTGNHYRIADLQLFPALAQDYSPGLFIAGHSRPAVNLASRIGAQRMCMLPPRSDQSAEPGSALHFGAVVAESWDEAREAAVALFPADEDGPEIVAASMKNTDALWKQNLYREAEKHHETAPIAPGLWLHPFRTGQADCPYLVGSRSDMAEMLLRLICGGNSTFVVEIPVRDRELTEFARTLDMVRKTLADH